MFRRCCLSPPEELAPPVPPPPNPPPPPPEPPLPLRSRRSGVRLPPLSPEGLCLSEDVEVGSDLKDGK